MDFTPAKYFDKIDEDEKEAARIDPTPKKSLLGRVWGLRTAIV
jgi:amino acid transporter